MAHFAEIDTNNVVLRVIRISDDDCAGGEFPLSEEYGQSFIHKLGLGGVWKQTSYNSNFRKNYAAIGGTYDSERDAFIPRRPFSSWILDEDTCMWIPPKPEGEW